MNVKKLIVLCKTNKIIKYMTRINSGIKPSSLIDQHLLAELRELPRIFTSVKKRIEKDIGFDDIPDEFVLGSGHCKFFYDKLYFLWSRYSLLRINYHNRYNKKYPIEIEYDDVFTKPSYLSKGYIPTEKERELLIKRISTRIMESKQIPRYYGKKISKDDAIKLLR